MTQLAPPLSSGTPNSGLAAIAGGRFSNARVVDHTLSHDPGLPNGFSPKWEELRLVHIKDYSIKSFIESVERLGFEVLPLDPSNSKNSLAGEPVNLLEPSDVEKFAQPLRELNEGMHTAVYRLRLAPLNNPYEERDVVVKLWETESVKCSKEIALEFLNSAERFITTLSPKLPLILPSLGCIRCTQDFREDLSRICGIVMPFVPGIDATEALQHGMVGRLMLADFVTEFITAVDSYNEKFQCSILAWEFKLSSFLVAKPEELENWQLELGSTLVGQGSIGARVGFLIDHGSLKDGSSSAELEGDRQLSNAARTNLYSTIFLEPTNVETAESLRIISSIETLLDRYNKAYPLKGSNINAPLTEHPVTENEVEQMRENVKLDRQSSINRLLIAHAHRGLNEVVRDRELLNKSSLDFADLDAAFAPLRPVWHHFPDANWSLRNKLYPLTITVSDLVESLINLTKQENERVLSAL